MSIVETSAASVGLAVPPSLLPMVTSVGRVPSTEACHRPGCFAPVKFPGRTLAPWPSGPGRKSLGETARRGAGTDDWCHHQCVNGCDPARMCATLVVPPVHDA